ncbi:peptidase [Marinicauda salina]|jgi:hypothetical protein|uniref:Peptidase n=1 Tax=Marinicauda salina TaxID=2135793 RepID=A0A2U2BV09_9PROT|nr:SapC family protein [Marinicauda salina]PWE17819.1 peptidase [Marinicauda salina]
MADAAASQGQIKGTLPLYKRPEPLNVAQHKGKGLKYPERKFGFLQESHFVPITVGEFTAAASRFPIIFLGQTRTPVAAMGLNAGSNLFVDPETGDFEKFSYIPAYARRYPFVSAVMDGGERYTVCIDADSEMISDKPDEPFFNDDDQPSNLTQRAIDFVQRYEADVKATERFIERLQELDLFEEQTTTYQPRDAAGQPQGEPQTIAQYWGVSADKLKDLPADTFSEFRDSAILGAIYAHMISMGQWEYLIQRAIAREAGAGGAADVSAPPPPPSPEA